MMSIRKRGLLIQESCNNNPLTKKLLVYFIGLNAARAFSLIALILVFSSTIFVMASNIKAVNYFEAHRGSNSTIDDCDYIE